MRRTCDEVLASTNGAKAVTGSVPTILEKHTYFGPSDAPMFGVVHLPADGMVRGGVLLCASLGKDASDTVRAQRLMADELAARGFMVMRFDYLGCGDSSYRQLRPTALAEWQESVLHAAQYLRRSGVRDISVVALRAGGLIADRVLGDIDGLQRVVYWDPVGAGRRFIREQTSFLKLATGPDDVPTGVVSIIGLRFAAESAAQFSALRIGAPGDDRLDRLVIGRVADTDKQVAALIDAAAADSVVVDGFVESAQPTRILTPVPFAAIDAAVGWLDAKGPGTLQKVSPAYSLSARIPDGDGGHAIERIETIGPRSMFAIRTLPDGSGVETPTLPTVVFFTNANNGHFGPNREWVELSRTVAGAGGQALRWDRQGAAESAPVRRDEIVYVYSDRGIADALAAVEHVKPTADTLMLTGPCSGAWYAAVGAQDLGADAVLMLNQVVWSRRLKKSAWEPIQAGDSDATNWEDSRRARLRRLGQKVLPKLVWRQIGRTGVVQAPEVLLAPLARRGVSTTVLLCPEDTALFRSNGGEDALKRLRKTSAPPTAIMTDSGDHACFHQGVFGEFRTEVMRFITSHSIPKMIGDEVRGGRTTQPGR